MVASDSRAAMEEGVPPPQLEFMFADASVITGVVFLNKAARLNPMRWHGGSAPEVVAELAAIAAKGSEDAGKRVQLRRKSHAGPFFSPAEAEAGRACLTQGALELTFDNPVSARDWIVEKIIDASAQPEPEPAVYVGGGMTVDPARVGAGTLNIAGGAVGPRKGLDDTELARLQALYDTPDEPDQDFEQLIEGVAHQALRNHEERTPEGLVGPSMHGSLLKTTRGGTNKKARHFVLNGRRLYYFDEVRDALAILSCILDSDGVSAVQVQATENRALSCPRRFNAESTSTSVHKGWQDLVGCRLEILVSTSPLRRKHRVAT
eukprot:COSAG02_NODE_2795_length_8014_cov_4.340114_3_plen_320_part_00